MCVMHKRGQVCVELTLEILNALYRIIKDSTTGSRALRVYYGYTMAMEGEMFVTLSCDAIIERTHQRGMQ